ncbi:MAG TPA: PEP-CTERM sorting domain-containing protein [Syntrophales bacterium]|nr:PEP-CTERM sorting domain-containing protein [Syntrophales bacterium]
MKKYLWGFMAAIFLFVPLLAHANVLTFDELTGQAPMLSSYQGIISWEPGSWSYYSWVQSPYNPHSGTTRLYAADRTPSWDFLTPAVYNGSWFSAISNVSLQMDLYLQGVLVYSTGTFGSLSNVPTFLATNYSGLVDRVVINTTGPRSWVMDDLTYTPSGTTSIVPEPSILLLLGTGLAGLAGVRKFKK